MRFSYYFLRIRLAAFNLYPSGGGRGEDHPLKMSPGWISLLLRQSPARLETWEDLGDIATVGAVAVAPLVMGVVLELFHRSGQAQFYSSAQVAVGGLPSRN